jgi:hypothetical protein
MRSSWSLTDGPASPVVLGHLGRARLSSVSPRHVAARLMLAVKLRFAMDLVFLLADVVGASIQVF